MKKEDYIWTNGCFDIIHVGHMKLFNYMKDLAKRLNCKIVIGLDSDERVQQSKGYGRPINTFEDRQLMIQEIFDYQVEVKKFDTDEALRNLVLFYQPKVMVVGSDWKDKKVIGAEFAHEVSYFDRDKNSTTNIIQRITTHPALGGQFGGKPVAAPQYNPGWSCPNCGRGYSPYTTMCGFCGPTYHTWISDGTGIKWVNEPTKTISNVPYLHPYQYNIT